MQARGHALHVAQPALWVHFQHSPSQRLLQLVDLQRETFWQTFALA